MKFEVDWYKKITGQTAKTGSKTFSTNTEAVEWVTSEVREKYPSFSRCNPKNFHFTFIATDEDQIGYFIWPVSGSKTDSEDSESRLKVGDIVNVIFVSDMGGIDDEEKGLICRVDDKYCVVDIDEDPYAGSPFGQALTFVPMGTSLGDADTVPSTCLFDSLNELESFYRSRAVKLEVVERKGQDDK